MAAQTARGFLMGAADIVPGVSGGTVALLVGIYDRLIDGVRDAARALGALVRADLAGFRSKLRQVDWAFLVPLLVGILAAIAALSSLIENLLHDHPEAMAGLFSGLVLASIVVAAAMVERWIPPVAAVAAIVAVVTFALLGAQSGPVADPPLVAWFASGTIAICAMILPGISGSFLLLMMGMYAPVLAAVNERSLVDLGVFAVGAVIGLALFSTLLGELLQRARDLTVAALVGLMVGSMRVLWPWPNGVGIISDHEDEAIDGTGLDWPATWGDTVLPTLLCVAAVVVVLTLTRLAGRRAR